MEFGKGDERWLAPGSADKKVLTFRRENDEPLYCCGGAKVLSYLSCQRYDYIWPPRQR